jgi:hypothetical protein
MVKPFVDQYATSKVARVFMGHGSGKKIQEILCEMDQYKRRT